MIKRSAWARFFAAGSLCCVLAMTEGCGLVLTHGPPVGHEQMYQFDCTESRTGPILDLAAAGLTISSAVSLAGDDSSSDDLVAGLLIAYAVEAALYTTSGFIGLKKVSRCREARALLAERLATQRLADSIRRSAGGDSIPSAVHVEPAQVSIAVGDRVQLTATAVNSAGVAVPGLSFVWTSSDAAVASVDAGGMVTARREGRVMIAANTGGVVGIAEVVVTGPAHLAPPQNDEREYRWRTYLGSPALLPAGIPGLRLGVEFPVSRRPGG